MPKTSRRSTRLLERATRIAELDDELALRRAEFERLAGAEDGVARDDNDRKPEQLLQIAAAIVQIERELAVRRDEFERLVRAGGQEAEGINRETDELRPPALRPLAKASSLVARTQSVLDLSAQALTAHDVAARIGEPVDSIRAALSKLHARGTVERVSTGVYRSTTTTGHRRAAGEDD